MRVRYAYRLGKSGNGRPSWNSGRISCVHFAWFYVFLASQFPNYGRNGCGDCARYPWYCNKSRRRTDVMSCIAVVDNQWSRRTNYEQPPVLYLEDMIISTLNQLRQAPNEQLSNNLPAHLGLTWQGNVHCSSCLTVFVENLCPAANWENVW